MNKVRKLFRSLLGFRDSASVVTIGQYKGRCKTRDDAFKFRMGSGFPGDITRTHPANIEGCLNSLNSPINAYGVPVVVDSADTNKGLRPLAAGDSGLTQVYGFSVRPFPQQTRTGGDSAPFDSTTPATPPVGAISILRQGSIIARLNVGSTPPVKGGQVYVWVAATSGNHLQGQLESAANGGNTAVLSGAGSIATFQGPADANSNVEIIFNA